MRWVPWISTVSRPEQEAQGFHRNEGFFTYFRWYTPTVAFFDKSWRLNEIRRLSDYKPLRMSAAMARFTPMTLLFTLALCSVLIGGCAGKRQTAPPPDETLRAAIKENGRDEIRRAELLAHSERFSQILEDLLTATDETSQKLDKLLLDYDSDRESFEQTFERYNQERQALSKQTIVLHYEIKALTTPAEWKAIEAALAEITLARLDAQRTFVDGVFEMRRHMSADEWRAAFGSESSEGQ